MTEKLKKVCEDIEEVIGLSEMKIVEEESGFLEKLRKRIINESDLQSGEIEFSMTGELIPFELVEGEFKELVKRLKKYMPNKCISCHNFIDKLMGKELK